ncbi:MAG: hypothetical protein ABI807_12120 [Sporichthyaceae bacterium]
MTDTDEIRTALSDATALRGEVRVLHSATGSVRALARRRRTAALGSAAAAVGIFTIVALLALLGGPGPDRTTFTPSGPLTPTASPSLPAVAGGPRDLTTPIEIRPVLAEYPTCPSAGTTTPAAEGPSCYRLGAPWLVLSSLARAAVAPAAGVGGTASGDFGSLVVAMRQADQDAFAALTRDAVGRRIALVAGARVWSAPVLATPIRGGELQLDLPIDLLRRLLDVLGVPVE